METFRDQILLGHQHGLGNREIARHVGCHHRTVNYWLTKCGLPPNNPRGRPPERIDDEHSRCGKCGATVRNDEFALVRSLVDGRRLSSCRRCRYRRNKSALEGSPVRFFRDKESRLRQRCKRSSIENSLPTGHLLKLWSTQQGQCFYSETEMRLIIGTIREAVSVDRVDSCRGYHPDNVVLCINRVNSVKQDLTLEELELWIPAWYQKIVEWRRALDA